VAKKPSLSDLVSEQIGIKETTEQEIVEKRESRWRSIGVTLNQDEIDELDTIAQDMDVSRNSILRYGVLLFLQEYRAGRLALETEATRGSKLKMP
jgi:hypothetical protein